MSHYRGDKSANAAALLACLIVSFIILIVIGMGVGIGISAVK